MIRKLIVFFTVLACIGMAHTIALADEEVKISATPVTNSIYMVAGKGGNIGLLVGEDGTFLIDDQFAPLTEKIVAVIKDVGGGHPKFLINTHYHGDHTGGNENMGKEGTLIFSHDNSQRIFASISMEKLFMLFMHLMPIPMVTVLSTSRNPT